MFGVLLGRSLLCDEDSSEPKNIPSFYSKCYWPKKQEKPSATTLIGVAQSYLWTQLPAVASRSSVIGVVRSMVQFFGPGLWKSLVHPDDWERKQHLLDHVWAEGRHRESHQGHGVASGSQTTGSILVNGIPSLNQYGSSCSFLGSGGMMIRGFAVGVEIRQQGKVFQCRFMPRCSEAWWMEHLHGKQPYHDGAASWKKGWGSHGWTKNSMGAHRCACYVFDVRTRII